MAGASEMLERDESLPQRDVEHDDIEGLFAYAAPGAPAFPPRQRGRV
jgi:hypothetical protein